ncbi:MAG: hypothetical protein WBK55_06780 [Alphaproteobacteria bacterium]
MTLRTVTCLVLSAFLLVFASPALAGAEELSESEKVVFSFFKLNNHVPAYEEWIKNSQVYKAETGSETAKSEIFEKEMLRLKWNYGTYDPAADFIKIKTPVRLLLQGSTLAFIFPGAKPGEVPYFPFPYAKEWIALVLNDLDPLLELELSPAERAIAEKHVPKNTVIDGEVVLHARAVKAENTEQLRLNEIDHWMLIGETGNFELSAGGTTLATYTAPWFLEAARRKKELESLKSGSAPLLAQ